MGVGFRGSGEELLKMQKKTAVRLKKGTTSPKTKRAKTARKLRKENGGELFCKHH